MPASPPSSAGFFDDLFDFQVNGFGGVDFQRDDLDQPSFRRAVDTLRRHGIAQFFPTLITDGIDRLCRRLEHIESFCRRDPVCAAAVAGYHLEGPWLSPEPGYHGAHPPGPMHAPDEAEFHRLQAAASGRIRLVTLAPEWPRSAPFIASLATAGVHIALGHTAADDARIDDAITAGARFCTHLGNGVPLTLPRHDNIIQRLLARDELTACFIPDGLHLPPAVLRNFFRAKPPGRALFTTDAMAAAGAPPGAYTLGALSVSVGPDRVVRTGPGGPFAGSSLTPSEGVRHTADFLGLPLATAHHLWSGAPRAAFGLPPPAVSIFP